MADAAESKFQALQQIVVQQDKYIRELEDASRRRTDSTSSTGSERKDADDQRGRSQSDAAATPNKSAKVSPTSAASALPPLSLRAQIQRRDEAHHKRVEALKREHLDAEALWKKEKDLLQSLLERARSSNERLESTLSKERQEMERRVKRDVEALVHASGGTDNSASSTVVRSLQGELKRASKRATEMQEQVQELSQRLLEQNGAFTALLEREKRIHSVERTALQEKLDEALESVKQAHGKATGSEAQVQRRLEEVRREHAEREGRLRAQIVSLEAQVRSATQSLLEYSRRSASNESAPASEENNNASNAAPSTSTSTTSTSPSTALKKDKAPVLLPRAMRDEYEQRLMDVLKAKEASEAKLCAERQQLLEDVEKHDRQRDERMDLLYKDAGARIRHGEAFVCMLERRVEHLEHELEKAHNIVLRAGNNSKEREAAALVEINEIKTFFKGKLDHASSVNADCKDNIMRLEQALEDSRKQMDYKEAAHAQQMQQCSTTIEQLRRELQSGARAVVAGATAAPRSPDDEQRATSKALAAELANLQQLYHQCQQDLEDARKKDAVKHADFESKLAKQSELAAKLQQDCNTTIKEYHEKAAELRNVLHEAQTLHARQQAQSCQEMERWERKAKDAELWATQVEINAAAALKAAEDANAEQAIAHQKHTAKLRAFVCQVQKEFATFREETEVQRQQLLNKAERLQKREAELTQTLDEKEQARQRAVTAHQASQAVMQMRIERSTNQVRELQRRVEELQGLDDLGEGPSAERQRSVELAIAESKRVQNDLDDCAAQLVTRTAANDVAMGTVQEEVKALRESCASHHHHITQIRHEAFVQVSALKAEKNAVEARVTSEQAALVEAKEKLDSQANVLADAVKIFQAACKDCERDASCKISQAHELQHVAEQRLKVAEKELAHAQQQFDRLTDTLGRTSRAVEVASRDAVVILQEQLEAEKQQAVDKVKRLTEENARLTKQAQRARDFANETARVAEKQLRELHAETRELRRTATDLHVVMTQEKQTLVQQLDDLKARTQESQSHANKVFKQQINSLQVQEARARKESVDAGKRADMKTEAAKKEMERQAEQYIHDIRSLQQGLSILRSMEAERETHMKRELETIREHLTTIQQQARNVDQSKAKEIESMENDIATLRHACERSEAQLHAQGRAAEERRQSLVRRLSEATAASAARARKGGLSNVEGTGAEDAPARGARERSRTTSSSVASTSTISSRARAQSAQLRRSRR